MPTATSGPKHIDTIVIGVGSMGAAACYYLARKGHGVLGLEQFDVVHERGSHAGQSRIIRKAYFEHPAYVPLLERAYRNWASFEAESGTALYHETGIVYLGEKDHATMRGVRHSAEQHRIALTPLTREEAAREFPAFTIPDAFEILFEPSAGFITPERAIHAYRDAARRLGADIRTHERVTRWKPSRGKIEVETDKDVYTSDRLIITAGSWTSSLIPSLREKLSVTRQTLVWVNPKTPDAFALGNFPCWFVEDPRAGMFYGFPILPFENFGGPIGLKLASHRRGTPIDPDHSDRSVPATDERKILDFITRYIPDAEGEVVTSKSCLYTYSPDEHFIIDHVPGTDKRVVVACGFSGHGFKFVPAIGELLADMAIQGRAELPIGFLGLDRVYS